MKLRPGDQLSNLCTLVLHDVINIVVVVHRGDVENRENDSAVNTSFFFATFCLTAPPRGFLTSERCLPVPLCKFVAHLGETRFAQYIHMSVAMETGLSEGDCVADRAEERILERPVDAVPARSSSLTW